MVLLISVKIRAPYFKIISLIFVVKARDQFYERCAISDSNGKAKDKRTSLQQLKFLKLRAKGGSITVPLNSCLTGLELAA